MAVRNAYVSNASTSAQDVVLSGKGNAVRVTNLDGAGIVFFRNDGTTAAAADENYMLAAAAGASKVVLGFKASDTFSVYASATTKVGLEVINL